MKYPYHSTYHTVLWNCSHSCTVLYYYKTISQILGTVITISYSVLLMMQNDPVGRFAQSQRDVLGLWVKVPSSFIAV